MERPVYIYIYTIRWWTKFKYFYSDAFKSFFFFFFLKYATTSMLPPESSDDSHAPEEVVVHDAFTTLLDRWHNIEACVIVVHDTFTTLLDQWHNNKTCVIVVHDAFTTLLDHWHKACVIVEKMQSVCNFFHIWHMIAKEWGILDKCINKCTDTKKKLWVLSL